VDIYQIEIVATGAHGCDRRAQPGEPLHGCGDATCPDCAARAFVERLRRRGAFDHGGSATFTHNAGQVIDDLVTGTRMRGTFEDSI
jgi:hypothetical protein